MGGLEGALSVILGLDQNMKIPKNKVFIVSHFCLWQCIFVAYICLVGPVLFQINVRLFISSFIF